MNKKDIIYMMDKCLNFYRIAYVEKENRYNKIIAIAKGNLLKELIEEKIDRQLTSEENNKYLDIVKYYQLLN